MRQLHLRLVTLCGATDSKFDAVVDSQEILEARYRNAGLKVDPVDLGDWSFQMLPSILQEISRLSPDVILMQYPTRAFGNSLTPVAISAIQRIAPLVVMLHEFVAAHPLRKVAVSALLARADLIAVTADREAEALSRWNPWLRHRLRQIPIASNIPSRAWTPASPPTIVYFGQLRPEKGLEAFLECQAVISRALPQTLFRIIGASVPKFADYGRMICDRAQTAGIAITAAAESEEVADALSHATIALLPFPDGASFRRGSLFAAAGCGVPIVTLVGDDTPPGLLPYLEPARDVAELSEMTSRYLSDPRSLTAAHERSVRLSQQFGWDKTVSRYLDVFREAASKRARAGRVLDTIS